MPWFLFQRRATGRPKNRGPADRSIGGAKRGLSPRATAFGSWSFEASGRSRAFLLRSWWCGAPREFVLLEVEEGSCF